MEGVGKGFVLSSVSQSVACDHGLQISLGLYKKTDPWAPPQLLNLGLWGQDPGMCGTDKPLGGCSVNRVYEPSILSVQTSRNYGQRPDPAGSIWAEVEAQRSRQIYILEKSLWMLKDRLEGEANSDSEG